VASSAARSPLVWPNVLVLTTLVLHDLDHVRQGRDIEAPVVTLGILGDLLVIGSLVMAARGHRLAPPIAAFTGFAIALGFVLVHVVPDWGPLSQGYPDLGVDVLSWVAALVPLAAGIVLGLAGLSAMRARPADAPVG
jgi:hypothetical protein